MAEFAAQKSLSLGAHPSTDGEYQARTVQHLVQRLLLDHGWLPDQSHITWVYPHAFGVGDPGGLCDDRLAEYGPHPPILQLEPNKLIVVPHGQTHGSPRHLRAPRTTALCDPSQLNTINAAITAVEKVAATPTSIAAASTTATAAASSTTAKRVACPGPATPPSTRSRSSASSARRTFDDVIDEPQAWLRDSVQQRTQPVAADKIPMEQSVR